MAADLIRSKSVSIMFGHRNSNLGTPLRGEVLKALASGSNGDRLPTNATRANTPRISAACAGATLKMSHSSLPDQLAESLAQAFVLLEPTTAGKPPFHCISNRKSGSYERKEPLGAVGAPFNPIHAI